MALKKLQTLFKDTVTGLFYNYNNTGTDLEQVTLGAGSVTTVTGSSPIIVTNNTTTPNISIATASTSTTGVLTATDWNTFNNKTSGGVNFITTEKPLAQTTETVGLNKIVTVKLYDPFNLGTVLTANETYLFDCTTGFNKTIVVNGNVTVQIQNAENGDMGCLIVIPETTSDFNITIIGDPDSRYIKTNKAFSNLTYTAGYYILTWVKGPKSEYASFTNEDLYFINIASYKEY